jgi:N-acetylmuramoyl-L-alanine amidase
MRFLLAAAVFALAGAGISYGRVEAATDYLHLLGDDTYHTSVLVSKAGFAPGVQAVVVANGDEYMSATSSAVLAAVYGGPVLLTPGDSLDGRVFAELLRLRPERIFLVDAEAKVLAAVQDALPKLAGAGRVIVLNGASGRETACLIAQQVKAATGMPGGVVLVSEDRTVAPPACAAAASVLAAGKGWPLLFVPSSGRIPSAVGKVVVDLAPAVVIEIQTTADVGVKGMVVRLAGSNLYEVGAKIADYASSVGLSYGHTTVISGSDESGGQGLSIGSYLARNSGIAVICGASYVPEETIDLLLGKAEEVRRLDFCGPQTGTCERIAAVMRTQGALPAGFGTMTFRRGSQGSAVKWLEQRLTDLSYRPGKVDGRFDDRTRQAVIAFEKWEGLERDGIAEPEVWWRLLAASRPVPTTALTGVWIEVDKTKQLLLYCVDGQVERTLAVSTGSLRRGIETPSGIFRVTRENTRERYRYKPLYLRTFGHLAIHGYNSVPVFADSHGCVRTTRVDMDELHAKVPVGTAVYIY